MGARRRRIVWSEGARRELDEAVSYIAEDSIASAIRILEQILGSAESLGTLGERGRVVPERGDPSIRELLVDPFRLLYHLRDSDIVILGILHQRRTYERWPRRSS
ncbi:MAG: type II toxin-antitoxin system RelE/ParE family toxin [Gemmatimonadales bacterium]|nr:MAG: type II toxin-antitoxin system RelE/ParE family toxin [Gemmatimonadales bacterium]